MTNGLLERFGDLSDVNYETSHRVDFIRKSLEKIELGLGEGQVI